MNIVIIIIELAISIVCAYIHKSKGYSPVTGFLWGFFFSLIGLAIVLLEKDKEEHDMQDGMSMSTWLIIFLIIGILLLVVAFAFMAT